MHFVRTPMFVSYAESVSVKCMKSMCRAYSTTLYNTTLYKETIHSFLFQRINVSHVFSSLFFREVWNSAHASLIHIQNSTFAGVLKHKNATVTTLILAGGHTDFRDVSVHGWKAVRQQLISLRTSGNSAINGIRHEKWAIINWTVAVWIPLTYTVTREQISKIINNFERRAAVV